MNFPSTLGNLYVAPTEAFRDIVARPRWLAPFLVLMCLNIAFTAVWMSKVDPRAFMRAEMEQSGAMDRVPPEKVAEIMETQTRMFPVMGWVGALLGPIIVYLLLAGVFLFVFRFFFGGDVTFPQSLSIIVWSFLTVAIVSVPLMLLVFTLKGDWNLNPANVIQASPAALLERNEVSKPLYTLASSFELFMLWALSLFSAGYAVALRRPWGSAAVGVFACWAIWVLGKVALSAVF